MTTQKAKLGPDNNTTADFYTPPVLGSAAFLEIQRQRCIKILCPKGPELYTPLPLSCQKVRHLRALEVC